MDGRLHRCPNRRVMLPAAPLGRARGRRDESKDCRRRATRRVPKCADASIASGRLVMEPQEAQYQFVLELLVNPNWYWSNSPPRTRRRPRASSRAGCGTQLSRAEFDPCPEDRVSHDALATRPPALRTRASATPVPGRAIQGVAATNDGAVPVGVAQPEMGMSNTAPQRRVIHIFISGSV